MCGLLALSGSFAVAVTYHLGYPEFQRRAVISPVTGSWSSAIANEEPYRSRGGSCDEAHSCVLHGPANNCSIATALLDIRMENGANARSSAMRLSPPG
jgi:hypothetical protein